MATHTKENQIFFLRWFVVFSAILFLTLPYFFFGHSVIQAIYEGRSYPFLNSLIEGQQNFPLKVYLETADGMFSGFLFICLLVFLIAGVVYFEPPSRDRWRWRLARMLTLFMVSMVFFRPYLLENELVYLIHPKRIFDPSFLSSDWTWNRGVYTHLVYDWLLAPFTLFLSNLKIVIIGRLIFWVLAIETLARLAKMWGLKWWQFTLGIAYYLYAGQTLAATEALFGGLEAKYFAYLFLLLALDSRFKNEFEKTAVFCGLAVSFHALVGTWSALAVIATLAAARSSFTAKRAGLFFLLLFLCAAPGILTAVTYLSESGQVTREHLALEIFFRAPHHLDPWFFLTPARAVEIFVYYGLTVFFIWACLKREHALILFIFLTTLMGVFIAGLLAREMGWLSFLYRYPFRVGPVFLLLIFSFVAFRGLEGSRRSPKKSAKAAGLILFLFLVFQGLRHQMPVTLLKDTGDFMMSWEKHFLKSDEDNFAKAAKWIRDNTPRNSIFAAPPWEYRFWIEAERAEVVCYKYLFVDKTIEEWIARLKDLNGGNVFTKRGSAVLGEMKENFPYLSQEQLAQIRSRYHASYYLTTKERKDLADRLVYSNPTYYLYRLAGKT